MTSAGLWFPREARVGKMVLVVALLVVLGLSRPGASSSRPCTCDDIDDMKDSLQTIDKTREAWYSVLADIYGQAHAPKDMAEAVKKFEGYMGWTSSKKVGGLTPIGINSKGDTAIDPDYESAHCDRVVEGVRVHENSHYWYFVVRSIPIAMSGPRGLARILAKSEIEARNDQESFLVGELRALSKRCGRDFTWKPRKPKRIQGT